LNKDKTALLKARATLATIPKPEGFQPSVKDAQGSIFKISWPLNLNVIDDLIKCFDQPYKIAYGCSAR
jgi:hypothetical protein